MKKIVAVIPAAGLGTRFLPVTRVVPKEMLPIGARPALELIVEEAREAGAEEVVVVISEGKELIRRYFDSAPHVRFVYQREQKGLGDAVLQAEGEVARSGADRVLVLLGDAVVIGGSAASELVALSRNRGDASVIGFERVRREKVSRYGIARPAAELSEDATEFELADLVEKPSVEDAPSNLAVAGRYLLDVEIFRLLSDQAAGVGGEVQLTDAIRRMIPARKVLGCVYGGRRQDIGNPEGYFKALEAYHDCN
jgi:UTP--glucose-1-phosphate uridylyltransferase